MSDYRIMERLIHETEIELKSLRAENKRLTNERDNLNKPMVEWLGKKREALRATLDKIRMIARATVIAGPNMTKPEDAWLKFSQITVIAKDALYQDRQDKVLDETEQYNDLMWAHNRLDHLLTVYSEGCINRNDFSGPAETMVIIAEELPKCAKNMVLNRLGRMDEVKRRMRRRNHSNPYEA